MTTATLSQAVLETKGLTAGRRIAHSNPTVSDLNLTIRMEHMTTFILVFIYGTSEGNRKYQDRLSHTAH